MKGVGVEYPMYFGAKPSIFKLAKELRKDETEAEKRLWTRLNRNQIQGLQFRRQHPINMFIADLYCPKIKLIVEVDGSIHEISEYEEHDIGRSDMLIDFGITVVRFTNDQVLNNLDGTINQIECIVKKCLMSNMLGIFNSNGDTLSAFTQHEKLVNYTKSLQRGTDSGNHYEHNGKTYFRNAFNDTIFQVIPPNRLKPVFVLNLGIYKVTRQQGVDPGYDLTGKIIPWEMAETEKYIFLTFTKDGYDCPNSRKNKAVKIYHALFSKKDHKLTVIKGDPFNYSPDIIENNLDGGVPVWPSTEMIGKNGEILISLKGKDLKERIRSGFFNGSSAPEVKKEELKKLAALVSDNEDILMLIK